MKVRGSRLALMAAAAITLVVGGCSSPVASHVPAVTASPSTPVPPSTSGTAIPPVPPPAAVPQPNATVDRGGLPLIDSWALTPTAPVDDGTAVITQLAYVGEAGALVYTAPGGDVLGLLAGRSLQDLTVTPVLATAFDRRWVRVELPSRLHTASTGAVNGASGWLWNAELSGVSAVTQSVHVDLAAETVTVLDAAGNVTFSTPTAIGANATPTPVGRGYLVSRWTEKSQTPRVAALSMHSATLDAFKDDPAVTALHTVSGLPSSGRVSNGCLRLPTTAAWNVIAGLPIGTPVLITAGA